MKKRRDTPSTSRVKQPRPGGKGKSTGRRPDVVKARRDVTGGKRGEGHRRKRRVRRPDPNSIGRGQPDATLTGVGGLVDFGVFLRRLNIDEELRNGFNHLKPARGVVYSMSNQMRLLLDTITVGGGRVFDVEGLAADPLFVHLSGGVVPSIDVLYDDLRRFDDATLAKLESLMATHGLHALSQVRRRGYVHVDIDTTVCQQSGEREGALPGPNAQYHGRSSFHPILARVAETATIIGAKLRPGNTGFGVDDTETLRSWLTRAHDVARHGVSLCARIDSAGDCAEVLRTLHDVKTFYVIKAKLSRDLLGALSLVTQWSTKDVDADNKPIRQVAELDFCRDTWSDIGHKVRVIAVRSIERHGKQLLFSDIEPWTYQMFLTNRVDDADDIAWDYDGRAGIEPLIAELKRAWSIGASSSYSFAANHALFLLKMLAHNLLERYATQHFSTLARWRTPWLRRTLLCVPGRLSRSGRRRKLHLPPGSPLLISKRE